MLRPFDMDQVSMRRTAAFTVWPRYFVSTQLKATSERYLELIPDYGNKATPQAPLLMK